jgi:hypothetical protein
MLFRSIIITIIWLTLVGPIVKKLFQKYLAGKKSFYADEISEIMDLFPQFKKLFLTAGKIHLTKTELKEFINFFQLHFIIYC